MNPMLRESIAKGVFLGLWSYLALIQPEPGLFGQILGAAAGGLALGLLAGAALQFSRGFRPGRNLPGFVLLTLLDSAYFIYLGLIGGLALGLLLLTDPPQTLLRPGELLPAGEANSADSAAPALAALPGKDWLLGFVLGGAFLGYGFHQLRDIRDWFYRILLGAILAGLLMVLAVHYAPQLPTLAGLGAQRQFGIYLLASLPFFYVLILCSEADESEAEIGAWCATAGVGLYLLRLESKLPETFDKLILLVPLGFYYVYATRWLPGLKVFKHNLRGYGMLSLGRAEAALRSFSRALTHDPRNSLAQAGVRKLLRQIPLHTLEPEALDLVPLPVLRDYVQGLLLGPQPPGAEPLAEAQSLLTRLEQTHPDEAPRWAYLRAVALTHARDFDQAAETLRQLLDPHLERSAAARVHRASLLLPAWQLATSLHPELTARLGAAELARPGRRIEAIATLETALAAAPQDPWLIGWQRELYAGLTEAEYLAAATQGPLPASQFNYDLVESLGRVLLEDSNPVQVERGMAYLRLAARAEPLRAMQIFKDLAQAATARHQDDEALGYRGQIKRIGLTLGPERLPAEAKSLYLETLQQLAQQAAARQDFSAAVDDYRLFVEAGQETPETLRQLADWYARAGDPLNALLIVERGLLYAKQDADLLAKKDSYYFSLDLAQVQRVREKLTGWFDGPYLIGRAQRIVDQREVDPETLDYALHCVLLARIVQPTSQVAWYLEARLRLRRGERDQAVQLLEDLREQPTGRGDDEDAWYAAIRRLGDLYLEELDRPDLAIPCYQKFRESEKSGVETLMNLGRAFEAVGNIAAAIKTYESVEVYTNHPRRYEASQQVRRLKGGF